MDVYQLARLSTSVPAPLTKLKANCAHAVDMLEPL